MSAADVPVGRRAVLMGGAAAAGGILLGIATPVAAAPRRPIAAALAGSSTDGAVAAAAPAPATAVGAWVRIDAQSNVTILVGSSEMGQGVLTSLAQIVAEELGVSWKKVRSEHAPPSHLYDNPAYHTQLTAGSGSVRGYYTSLRIAGATVKAMLVAAAAQQLGVPASTLVAKAGKVRIKGTTTALTYGQLAPIAAGLTPPASVTLTDPAKFTLIGTDAPRVDIPDKVRGAAVYGIDVRVPGMVYATVKHCPSIGGTVAAMPAPPPGAIALVDLGGAVGVVANSTWEAFKIARSLTVTWNRPANASEMTSSSIASTARSLMASGAPLAAQPPVGDAEARIAAATATIDATYSLPYLPHACMEPLNCTALVTPDRCEVWAPTQAQQSTQATAMAVTGLPAAQVIVHTTMLGGGLGRKFEQDYIRQAVTLAKAVGTPVKLTWRREEDFGHDQYRPTALINVRAGLAADGSVSGWHYRHVSPSILGQRFPLAGPDSQATEGSTALMYGLGDTLVEWVKHPAPVPVGFWRSVGHSLNAFAVESAIDELAALSGTDPLAFRLRLLSGHADALAVVQTAADLAGWGTPLPTGRARGIAFHESFGSLVCEVAEVSQPSPGQIKVHRMSAAIDCGTVVNPDIVKAQIEGGIIHGLTAALWGRVTVQNGVISPVNFDEFRMTKLRDAPDLAVAVLASGRPIGGAGEPGVPPVAPAIANAWFALTGERKRSLPF